MATEQLRAFLRHLRRGGESPTVDGVPDAQLLERFVTRRDEAAFEVLVWRHGGLVLSVCGRVLRHTEDIEDVFQATFLALTRRAGSICNAESLGSWLYKVAYRVALRARTARAAARQLRASDEPAPRSADSEVAPDLRPVLDEEINRLPEKYRTPVILCYLQGRTTQDAARELGCPRGTVCSRLSWARRRLRARLMRRGLAISAAGLPGVLGMGPAPAALVAATVRAATAFVSGSTAGRALPAVTLAEGVLRAMTITKLKIAATLVLILGVSGLGAGLGAQRAISNTDSDPSRVIGQMDRDFARKKDGWGPLLLPVRAGFPPPICEDPPSDQEVLRVMPRVPRGVPHIVETFRDDMVIVKKRLVDPAQQHRCRWECVVHYTETVQSDYPFPVKVKRQRTEIVYIDINQLADKPGADATPVLVRGTGDGIRLPPDMLAKMGIQVVEVRPRTGARVLEFTGSLAIMPDRLTRIPCRSAPAEVIHIGKTEEKDGSRELRAGDKVRKGQVLAVLRSAVVFEKKTALFDAVLKSRLDGDILARAEKQPDSVPQAFLLNARRNVVASRIALGRAAATLRALGIADEDVQAVFTEAAGADKPDPARVAVWDRVVLRSPTDGVLVERNVSLDEVIEDTAQTLFQIARMDQLKVLAQVPEADLPLLTALTPEQRRWTIRAAADGPDLPGRIDDIGVAIDPNLHTAVVTGSVENPDGWFRAGQFVKARVTLLPPGEVALPVGAVVEEGGQTFVLVQPDPKSFFYELRRVAVVRRGSDVVHIRGRLTPEQERQGLRTVRPGDRVVTAGAVELKAILEDLKAGDDR